MRKTLNQQPPRPRQFGSPVLHLQPFANIIRELPPARPVRQQGLDPPREMRGQRQPLTHIARDLSGLLGSAHHQFGITHHLNFQIESGEAERLAGPQPRGKVFFDPPQ